MATIVTRAGKGSPLTNTEVDANFTNLNSELGTKANTSALASYQPLLGYTPVNRAGDSMLGDLYMESYWLYMRYNGGDQIRMNSYGPGIDFYNQTLGAHAYIRAGIGNFVNDVRAPIFYDNANTAYYIDPNSTSNLNALSVGGKSVIGSSLIAPYMTSSDFPNGTLVATNIDASVSNGDSFIIEITGKSYDNANPPFKVVAQGYIYNDSIIAISGISYGGDFASYIKVFNDGGVLKFWWPRITYWNSFNVSVRGMNSADNGTITTNRVTSISDSTEPTGTKKVQINLSRFMRGDVSATNSVDLRAPIFYDSNDTSYLVNPNGTSYLNNVTTYGSLVSSSHLYTRADIFSLNAAENGWNTVVWRNGGSHIVYGGNSVRAPIFYDSDNTSYYLDPNSNSVLNTLYLASSAVTQTKFANASYFGYSAGYKTIVLGGESMATISMGVDVSGNSGGTFNGTGEGREVLFRNGVNFLTPNSANTNYLATLNMTDGYVSSPGSFRAPIFYDSSDTSYYVDPNGSTALFSNGLVVAGTEGFSSRYFSTGARNRIWSFYNADGYGLSYFQGTAGIGGNDTIGLHFGTATSGSSQFAFVASGLATASSSWRAPIFYDSDDTNYYLNPNGTDAGKLRGYLNFNDYGAGVVGLYDSYKYQLVFAMGRSYTGAIDGTNVTGGYGLYWSHPNAGGVAANLDTHGLMSIVNGAWMAPLSSSTRAANDMRAPLFYDLNNTAYFVDPNSTSVMSVVRAAGIQHSNGNTAIDLDNGTYTQFRDPTGTVGLWLGAGDPANYYNNTTHYFRNRSSTVQLTINDSYVDHVAGMRALAFYDRVNTAYYIDPNSELSLKIAGRIEGGFGATSTGGTADWNHSSNTVSGSAYSLLLGNATNGPGPSNYYHPFNFEYNTKDGSGNVTQLAIPYGSPGNQLWMRGRYNGSWSGWVEFLSTSSSEQTKSGRLISSTDMRAPLFYDSNDTGYYVNPNGSSNCYSMTMADTIYSYGWFRSYGDTGWYNQTYAGGMYMIDTTWVRVYNSKALYVGNEIAATGNITAYYSDERLKTKTGSISGALAKVSALDGFLYVENDLARSLGYTNDRRQVGVSAQAVQSVLPEAVSLAPVDFETLEDGTIVSKSGENYLTVDYSRLVPLLIEAIKELKSEVDTLKATVH